MSDVEARPACPTTDACLAPVPPRPGEGGQDTESLGPMTGTHEPSAIEQALIRWLDEI